jgi:hypothetical protein
LSRPRVANNLP